MASLLARVAGLPVSLESESESEIECGYSLGWKQLGDGHFGADRMGMRIGRDGWKEG